MLNKAATVLIGALLATTATAHALTLKLEDRGIAITSEALPATTLSYPLMQGPGDKTVAKAMEKTVTGATAVVKYDNGGQVNVGIKDGGKISFDFTGFGAEVKNWKLSLSLAGATASGAFWEIGPGGMKAFPAAKASPPHLFQGGASSFTFINRAGKSLSIAVPQYSFLQLTDLREWGTSEFSWSCFSPFYTENPHTTLSFSEGQTTVPAGAAAQADAPAPTATAPARKPVTLLPQLADSINTWDTVKMPFGTQFELVKDWTFGRKRANATIRSRADLDREFYYRYIYENGKLDTIPTYWTVHRDYPENDPRNLHVLGDDTLTLKAHIPEGGGLRKKGIESGMLRSKISITPGTYIEMRAKLTTGIGAWPAFWLNPGVQNPDGTFSEMAWPPEIDIFEFFNWQGRPHTKNMHMGIQTNKNNAKFGNPYDIFNATKDDEFTPGFDFSEGFHVFALDWREDQPIWLLDGQPLKQTHYVWNGPAAHILITNQLGIEFGDMKEMQVNEKNWDYVIDYIRVWRRKTS